MKIYTIIEGSLYQSARLAQLQPAEQVALIAENRINVVFNFWHTPDPAVAAVLQHGYYHFPISDGKSLVIGDELRRLVSLASARIVLGNQRVLSHCYGGRNRSALFSALVAMNILGSSGEQAVELVRAQRPNSLFNPHFVNLIMEYKP